MLRDKLKHQVREQFLSRDKFTLSRDANFISHRWLRYTMTGKQVNTAIDVFLVWLPVKYCDMLHHFFCIRRVYYKTLIPWILMCYYILNIKMTSQSLSNFTEPLACGSLALYKSLTMTVTSFLCSKTCCAKLPEFDWLRGMQLIRNCTGQIRAKICNRDLTGCFCRAQTCNCYLIGYFCRAKTCNSLWLDNFGWRWFKCFWFSNAEFYFLCYFHVLLQSDVITLSLMCLAGSRDTLYLLTELTMFTDWC